MAGRGLARIVWDTLTARDQVDRGPVGRAFRGRTTARQTARCCRWLNSSNRHRTRPHPCYSQRQGLCGHRYRDSESLECVTQIASKGQDQINTAGESLKRSPNRFACSLLIDRLPERTSETLARDPKMT